MAQPKVDPVRKRPRDRKAQIVAAAARLFWEQGYPQVAMADIASAVGIGASALYRHFRGKGDLLGAVLTDAVEQLEQAVGESADLDEMVTAIAEVMLRHREYSALWDRAGGQLAEPEYERLRDRRRALAGRISTAVDVVVGGSPEARDPRRVRAVSAVLESPSRHRVELDERRFVTLLHDAAMSALAVELPAGTSTPPVDGGTRLLPASRREALLAAAGRLMAERGYAAVSLDDIGAEIGIAGPSIYHHFTSKSDVLLSTLNRGNEALWFGLHQVLASADGPADALGRLVDSYVAIMAGNPEIISVLGREVNSLPEQHRVHFYRVQQDYVAEWVALLRGSRPELSEAEARVLVHAALGLVNSLSRSRLLRTRATITSDIGALGRSVLGLA
ncbi:TetR/AcrR family transcriptional regulator [Pseudonocardia spinosispora]|uniref:TetR/AcrR family transcriptional regulator n=1 Tax=Pseudonocardia spinosispora TaxID=103441 RepID=UPI0004086CF2|nr:TetR/AcrR family transcriptional regulator [Pseudonocardia spinosispora]